MDVLQVVTGMNLMVCIWTFERLVEGVVEICDDDQILFWAMHLLVNKFVRIGAFRVLQVLEDWYFNICLEY